MFRSRRTSPAVPGGPLAVAGAVRRRLPGPGYPHLMTTATETFPVDELRERAAARQFRPGRAAATVTGAVLAAIGWTAGRTLIILGWLGGRTWLILAYMAEAVVFGFRSGAGLPPKAPAGQPPGPGR